MPNRIIRESITTSHSWDELSFASECFCTRLITVVDDYGRMDARPSVLRAKCFPLKLSKVTDKLVAGWLAELIRADMVTVYQANGGVFLQFQNWSKYQNVRAKESKFPPPSDQVLTDDRICDQVQADVPVTRISDLGSRYSDLGESGASASKPKVFNREKAIEYAKTENFEGDVEAEIKKFHNHYDSTGWKDVRDVNARWRKWIDNAKDWQRPASGNAPPKPTHDPAITRNLYGPAYGSKLPTKAAS